MAQKKKSTSKKKGTAKKTAVKTQPTAKELELRQELIRWGVVLILLILTLGIYLKDSMGMIGTWVNELFVGLFGFSAYIITIYSMVIACIDLFGKLTKKLRGKLWFGYAFLLILSSILHLVNGKALNTVRLMYTGASLKTGGLAGGAIGSGLKALIGQTGAMIVLIFGLVLLAIALTGRSLVSGLKIFGFKTKEGTQKVVAFTDEKVAEARLRAEERAAYRDAEDQLKEEESGQISLERSPYRSSFFKRQKLASVKTDAAAREEAQKQAQDTSLGGKTLSEIADSKGVAQEAKTPEEETASAGAARMVSGAQAEIPDVKFTIPENMKRKTSSVKAASLQEAVQKVRSENSEEKQRRQTPEAVSIPGLDRDGFGDIYAERNAYRISAAQAKQEPMIDLPLVADDVYLAKKRRFLERTNQLNSPVSGAVTVNQENMSADVFRTSSDSEYTEGPAQDLTEEDTLQQAGQDGAFSENDTLPETADTERDFEEPQENAVDASFGQLDETEENEANEDSGSNVIAFPGAFSAKKDGPEIEEDDSLFDSEFDSPEEEDNSWEEPLSDEEAEASETIRVSTGKLYENETFPTGYEDRRETAERIQKENTAASGSSRTPGPSGTYQFPTIDLLNRPKEDAGILTEDEAVEESARKLKQVLKDFGVEIEEDVQVNRGPAVTRYEIKPRTGVKVSRIVSLTDDIAMNLAAQSIRIEAPIPGKSAVGIEIPNKDIRMVTLREVLESSEFSKASSKLTFALGRDIDNNCRVADVSKMPHLLIAGATGSGKSVCINSLIISLLYKADPNDVKLILIDPKVVELSVYNGIPHLLLPVVTDAKQASATLNWAVQEMTRRYKKFADCNVRDIRGFNEMTDNWSGDPESRPARMPQIVIVIDELADLMMVASKEVEASICRLAQLARAAGMHLVIATQRPSVDVITGLIKANIPSRIAFAVSSGIDSRTILDSVGAEKLLGKGDMLFAPMGASKPVRIQGTFVSDHEVEEVIAFIKEHVGTVSYPENLVEISAKSSDEDNGISEDTDEFLEEAAVLVIEKQKASISLLQRAFRIGFNRAARLMDALEEKGVVGEDQGSKPRAVLMTMSEWENIHG